MPLLGLWLILLWFLGKLGSSGNQPPDWVCLVRWCDDFTGKIKKVSPLHKVCWGAQKHFTETTHLHSSKLASVGELQLRNQTFCMAQSRSPWNSLHLVLHQQLWKRYVKRPVKIGTRCWFQCFEPCSVGTSRLGPSLGYSPGELMCHCSRAGEVFLPPAGLALLGCARCWTLSDVFFFVCLFFSRPWKISVVEQTEVVLLAS